MKSYLDILQNVLDNGEWQENRTGIKTLAVPNIHFEHDMSTGFPLLTTKKMAWKSMAVELEFFIRGITSKSWLKDRKCGFWNSWCNPKKLQRKIDLYVDKFNKQPTKEQTLNWQKEEDDLGPLGYSHSWRRFGQIAYEDHEGILKGYDQLDYIIQTLKTNPDDRRMVCSAWNPNDLDFVALPSCHLLWIVTHINGTLNLHWTQRSADAQLGIPVNIASYALLLSLLCKETNMKPGNLSGMFVNCHLYENHIDQAKGQLMREAKSLPTLKINNWNGFYNWEATDINFEQYDPHPPIKADVAV